MATLRAQQGLTLIELLFAVAISAIVLAALNSVVTLGLGAQSAGRSANELAYQGQFALRRMAAAARAVAPKLLTTPTANTSGNWFAPTGCTGAACVMYCRNGANQLIETTTTDASCAGTNVIAGNVSQFLAQAPTVPGPVNDPTASLSLTLTDPVGNNTLILTTSIRLGGGTL